VLSENTHTVPLPPLKLVDAWCPEQQGQPLLEAKRVAPRCSCPTSEKDAAARQEACRSTEPKLSVPPPPSFAAALARRVAEQSDRIAREDADMVQAQMPFYESPDGALNQIDVALLWAPTERVAKDGELAVHNRPPTRMHWWYSHGHPVLADGRMEAYKDAGQRVGYPPTLLNVSSASTLSKALCSIADKGTRTKLQALSTFGGSMSSPVVAGESLLVALCTLKKGWTSNSSVTSEQKRLTDHMVAPDFGDHVFSPEDIAPLAPRESTSEVTSDRRTQF
jgi:hypothetical protein